MFDEIRSKWDSGQDLMERWELEPYQLLECVKKGLPPHSPVTLKGFRIPGIFSFIDTHQLSEAVNKRSKGEESDLMEDWNYWTDISGLSELPDISECLFRKDEVAAFERLYEIQPGKVSKHPTKEKATKKTESHEDFVSSLRIWVESPSEIKIQEPAKNEVIYNCTSLGFRNENTKEWKALLGVLKSKDHKFNIGHVRRGHLQKERQEYDARRKLISQISKKLVAFLNKSYNANIPVSFNLFEHCPNEEPGTYRLKLCSPAGYEKIKKLKNEALECEKLTKDEAIKRVKKLNEEYKAILTSVAEEDKDRDYKLGIALKIKSQMIPAIRCAKTKGVNEGELPSTM